MKNLFVWISFYIFVANYGFSSNDQQVFQRDIDIFHSQRSYKVFSDNEQHSQRTIIARQKSKTVKANEFQNLSIGYKRMFAAACSYLLLGTSLPYVSATDQVCEGSSCSSFQGHLVTINSFTGVVRPEEVDLCGEGYSFGGGTMWSFKGKNSDSWYAVAIKPEPMLGIVFNQRGVGREQVIDITHHGREILAYEYMVIATPECKILNTPECRKAGCESSSACMEHHKCYGFTHRLVDVNAAGKIVPENRVSCHIHKRDHKVDFSKVGQREDWKGDLIKDGKAIRLGWTYSCEVTDSLKKATIIEVPKRETKDSITAEHYGFCVEGKKVKQIVSLRASVKHLCEDEHLGRVILHKKEFDITSYYDPYYWGNYFDPASALVSYVPRNKKLNIKCTMVTSDDKIAMCDEDGDLKVGQYLSSCSGVQVKNKPNHPEL